MLACQVQEELQRIAVEGQTQPPGLPALTQPGSPGLPALTQPGSPSLPALTQPGSPETFTATAPTSSASLPLGPQGHQRFGNDSMALDQP
jgi:hypothetical protein